jgi:hypothetical protein
MQASKKTFLTLLFVFAFLIVSLQAHAIGVRNCGPFYYDYAPYKTIDIAYEIVRAEHYDIEIEGPFAEFYDVQKEGSILTGLITLPPGFDEPGTHFNAITFTEQAIGLYGNAVAVAAIRCPVYIEYPYPGKYLLFDANIKNVNENERANVTIMIESKGDEPVRGALLEIAIGKPGRTEMIHTETFSLILPSEKIVKTIPMRTESLQPGLYEMRASLSYEQEKIDVTRQFRIGSLDINLLNITREVNVSPYTRIGFHLENNWNNPVRNVYVVYSIHSEEEKYGPQRSPGVDLMPFESQWAYSIIETPGLSPGTYFISYEIHFDDNVKHGITQLSVVANEKSSNLMPLLIAIGVVLMGILALLIFVLKRSGREEKKPARKGKK